MASKQVGYAEADAIPGIDIGNGWSVRCWRSPLYDGWTATVLKDLKSNPERYPCSTFATVRRKTEFGAKAAAIALAATLMALEEGAVPTEGVVIHAPKENRPADPALIAHVPGPPPEERPGPVGNDPAPPAGGMDGGDLPDPRGPVGRVGEEVIREPARKRSFFSG